jgi:hypothetical protein
MKNPAKQVLIHLCKDGPHLPMVVVSRVKHCSSASMVVASDSSITSPSGGMEERQPAVRARVPPLSCLAP